MPIYTEATRGVIGNTIVVKLLWYDMETLLGRTDAVESRDELLFVICHKLDQIS